MNEENKNVLVMMSSYNGEKYIADQILSIMKQEGPLNLQLLIRDDGSKDHTCEIVEKLMKKYSNIHLIKGKNIGYNASFFELLKHANSHKKYDYYALSDQDDFWLKDKVITGVKALEKENCRTPLLYASTSYLVKNDLKPYGMTRKKQRDFSPYNTLIQVICPGHTHIMNNATLQLVAKDIDVSRIYGYDAWIVNIVNLYGKVVFDNEPHTLYRQHEGNQLGSGNSKIGKLFSSLKKLNRGDGHKYMEQIRYFVAYNEKVLKEKNLYKDFYKFAYSSYKGKPLRTIKCPMYRQSKVETLAFKFSLFIGKFK